MPTWFNETAILSLNHNRQLVIKHGQRQTTTTIQHAADVAGTTVRTVTRWADGTTQAPEAALRLFSIVFFGVMPWEAWEAFRMVHGRDNHNRLRWLICHNEIQQFWTPERLLMIAHGYDLAAELRRDRDVLQECVTALSTRQAPPKPCAEIIHLEHYAKKNPV